MYVIELTGSDAASCVNEGDYKQPNKAARVVFVRMDKHATSDKATCGDALNPEAERERLLDGQRECRPRLLSGPAPASRCESFEFCTTSTSTTEELYIER